MTGSPEKDETSKEHLYQWVRPDPLPLEWQKKVLREMIGHSDISMTDRYSHLTPKHKLLQQRQLVE